MAKKKVASTDSTYVLEVGATHFRNSDGTTGAPLPPGVNIRSQSGVQIEFIWNGRRYTETLPGAPTEEAVRKAERKRESVLEDIEYNRFVYEYAFPQSRRVRRKDIEEQSKRLMAAAAVPTMRQLLSDFIEQYKKDNPHAHNTVATYEEVIRCRLAPVVSEMKPEEITKSFLIDFRSQLRNVPLSDKRVSNILTPLRGAIALAMERDILQVNPFNGLTPTTSKKRRGVKLDKAGLPAFDEPLPISLDPKIDGLAKLADPLSHLEREQVLSHMAGQIRNYFLFNFWTGLRSGEMIALRWCDVDLKNRRIIVRLSWSKKAYTPTKGRKSRWVMLSEPAIQALLAQWSITGRLGQWVFHNPKINDRWQNTERIRQHWIAALKAAGVRYRKPYQARHTFASSMLSAGEPAQWVADQMGHEDVSMLTDVYARWVRLPDVVPGASAAKRYADEWARAALMADHQNTVTPEMDMVDEGESVGPTQDDYEEDF